MALKEIATASATTSVSAPKSGVATITTPPSTKVKIEGVGVYRGDLSISVSGASNETATCTLAVGSGTLSPTAQKVKADGMAVIRKGDSASISVTGTNPQSGATCTFSVTVEITDAGQTKVKAQ